MNRRDFMNLILSAGVGAGISAVVARRDGGPYAGDKEPQEALDRILSTRVLRCGYVIGAPYFMKDVTTGALSGLFYDLTQKIGEKCELDVAWTMETTYATFTEDLRRDKFDVFGAGLWPSVPRAKAVAFSAPAFYSGVNLYVRADDHRFDGAPSRLDHSFYRLAVIDGEMAQAIQKTDFPKASVLSMPATTDISMLAEAVATGKADATLLQKAVAADYMRARPDVLRAVDLVRPLRLFENSWALAYGSQRLAAVLNVAIHEMVHDGSVDRILRHYGQDERFFSIQPPIQ